MKKFSGKKFGQDKNSGGKSYGKPGGKSGDKNRSFSKFRPKRDVEKSKPGSKPDFKSDSKTSGKFHQKRDHKKFDNKKPDYKKTFHDKPAHEKITHERANLYGVHAVAAAWMNPARRVRALYVTETSIKNFEDNINAAKSAGIKRPAPTLVDKAVLEKILPPGAVHQGIAIAAEALDEVFLQDIIIRAEMNERAVVLILDQVTDPHNVGAILRSASAFGAAGVIMQKMHAPELTGVLAKTACGAADHIPVAFETNLSRTIEEMKKSGFMVVGLDEHTEKAINTLRGNNKIVLVLGAEGAGLRRLIRENCDILVRLPTSGAIQSLNVSNAAAVAMYALLAH